MPAQRPWRFCIKCNAMFFDGFSTKGACPGGGGHNAEGLVFALPHDEPETATAQARWRFCRSCFVMFFDSDGPSGFCQANQDRGHDGSASIPYVLPHGVPASPTGQAGWRFCKKCFAMFFPGGASSGCPRGGAHDGSNSFPFVLPHTGESTGATLHVWTDSLRCHSETPGFGIGRATSPSCSWPSSTWSAATRSGSLPPRSCCTGRWPTSTTRRTTSSCRSDRSGSDPWRPSRRSSSPPSSSTTRSIPS